MTNETMKEVASSTVGGVLGGAVGVGGSTALVSTLGVTGLSAPGIVSGLAAVGVFETGMLGGLVVLTAGTGAIVIGGAVAGLLIYKALRK